MAQRLRIELEIALYAQGALSLGKAAELADVNRMPIIPNAQATALLRSRLCKASDSYRAGGVPAAFAGRRERFPAQSYTSQIRTQTTSGFTPVLFPLLCGLLACAGLGRG